jgi:hypothetical protein
MVENLTWTAGKAELGMMVDAVSVKSINILYLDGWHVFAFVLNFWQVNAPVCETPAGRLVGSTCSLVCSFKSIQKKT